VAPDRPLLPGRTEVDLDFLTPSLNGPREVRMKIVQQEDGDCSFRVSSLTLGRITQKTKYMTTSAAIIAYDLKNIMTPGLRGTDPFPFLWAKKRRAKIIVAQRASCAINDCGESQSSSHQFRRLV
jgi:hypothetical protein